MAATVAAAVAVADLPMPFWTLYRGKFCLLLLLAQRVRRARRVALHLAAQFLPLRAEPAAVGRVAPELLLQACVVLLLLTAETADQALMAVQAAVVPALCMGTAARAVPALRPVAVVAAVRVVTVQLAEQAGAVAAAAVALVLVTTVATPPPLAAVAVAQRPLRSSLTVVPVWVRAVLVT